MWVGFGVLMDPTRLGLAAILMSRRQAIRNLFAFWLGGMLSGISVGIVVLVLFRDVALVAIQSMVAAMNEVRAAVGFSGGRLQIAFGMLALVGFAVMVARQRTRVGDTISRRRRRASCSGAGAVQIVLRRPNGAADDERGVRGASASLYRGPRNERSTHRGTSSAHCDHGVEERTWDPGQRLRCVHSDDALFVEIPLLSYWAAPQRTEAVMFRLNGWIHGHRRQIMQTTLAISGVLFVVQGVGTL